MQKGVLALNAAVTSNEDTSVRPVTLPACGDKDGALPACAPLANPYVPYQNTGADKYGSRCALIRGTLFPGLDLPYLGMANTQEKSGTALHELQAMDFAITELGLYLDTHAEDSEAVELFNEYVESYQMAVQQYQQENGALTQMDSAQSGCYDWLEGPWPWDIEMEG